MDKEVGEIHGTRGGFEWRIINFFNLSENRFGYRSPDFYYNDVEWYFQIFPNGKCNNEYIVLRLYKANGNPISINFSLAIKTVCGEKHVERHCIEKFEKGIDSRAHTLFISWSKLFKKRAELVPYGVLTVVFSPKIQKSPNESDSTTKKCFFCKENLETECISFHEKCIDRKIKCPDCLDVISLQNWLRGYECQKNRTEAATNSTKSCVVHQHNKILQDFKQIFLKQENCDVVLKVKGRDFPAHKIILAARSSVFESTFRNDLKEKETGIVEIDDCDPFVFPDFLCFLYSNDVDNLSEENVFGLFTAADKYDVTDLRRKCLEFMKENLSVETFCETLTLALQHSEAELIHLATDFFIKSAKKFLVSVKWQSFAAENFTQSNELFVKYVESVEGPDT